MNRPSPSRVRRGYVDSSVRPISMKLVLSRCWISIALSSGTRLRDSPVSSSTVPSMLRTISSASSSRPWMNSQRGLSGTLRRTSSTARPRSAPRPKATRQPMSFGSTLGFSSTMVRAAPAAAPSQYEPLIDQVDPAAQPGRHRARRWPS